MQSVTITKFQTSDGQLWDDENIARTHEALLAERALIVSYAKETAPDNTRNQARIVSTIEKYIAYRAR